MFQAISISDRSCDFLDLKDFEFVIDLNVIVSFQRDAALGTGLDFLNVVFEAARELTSPVQIITLLRKRRA